jgi:hypothetical protein
MLQQGPQMTATEVLQRTEEKMRLLGPMLGRQQSEFLRPLIDRVFDIMLNNGLIPKQEIPAALQGKKIDVRYSSLIAKSQRLADGQNIMRTFEAITPAAQADISVLDNIDVDKVFRAIATVYGFPEEAIRPKKEVEQMFEENGDLVLFRPYRSYNISSYEKRELGIYGVYVTTPWPEKNKMVEVLINEL